MFSWKAKKSPTVKIGTQVLEVKPLSLESSLRLILLLSPHIAQVIKYWPHIQTNLKSGQVGPLELLLKDLAKELTFAPGDITQAFALCLDVEPEFIARNATAKDLIEALPTLDKANNFIDLFRACEALGVTNV